MLLDPRTQEDVVRLRIPTEFVVDERPPPASLETSFGRYALEFTEEAGMLVARRRVGIPLQTIPPEGYAEARACFESSRAADTAPVVFLRRLQTVGLERSSPALETLTALDGWRHAGSPGGKAIS